MMTPCNCGHQTELYGPRELGLPLTRRCNVQNLEFLDNCSIDSHMHSVYLILKQMYVCQQQSPLGSWKLLSSSDHCEQCQR
jgi:hypothetical protein